MENYTRIGKSVLVRAVGLQKNYKEFLTTDSSNHYTIKYINEKNQFGYQPRLKTNAIKLFLAYHFLNPDNQGLIKDVNLKELALLLNCKVQTIKANNELLQTYGYISFCDSAWHQNHITVCLCDYTNYHKTAKEGGRGYLTMSKELLFELLKITSINTLRLHIRALLDSDAATVISGSNTAILKSYEDLRRYLPFYCKRNVIKRSLEKCSSIFDICLEKMQVTFSIKEKYNSKKMKKTQEKLYLHEIKESVDCLNTMIHEISTDDILNTINAQKQLSVLPVESNQYKPLILKKSDYQDLALLAVQYTKQHVLEALSFVYNRYVNRNVPVNNPGGLVRTYLKHNYHLSVQKIKK